MAKSSFVIVLILFSLVSWGQETVPQKARKFEFSFQFGVSYKTFLSSKINDPTTNKNGCQYLDHQYERFRKTPTFGYSIGFMLNFKLNKHWGVSSGIQYFLRREVFKCDIDTAIKYSNGSSMRDIRNAYKFIYSYHNLELPVLIKYGLKRLTFYAGCNISLLSYKKSKFSYVINQYPNNPIWVTDEKTVNDFILPLKVFPTLQIDYKLQFNSLQINPWLALYYAYLNQYDIYVQLGFVIPIANITK